MNIEDGDAVHQSIAAPRISAPKETRSKRRVRKGDSKPGATVDARQANPCPGRRGGF
jgi:hypothetical protein